MPDTFGQLSPSKHVASRRPAVATLGWLADPFAKAGVDDPRRRTGPVPADVILDVSKPTWQISSSCRGRRRVRRRASCGNRWATGLPVWLKLVRFHSTSDRVLLPRMGLPETTIGSANTTFDETGTWHDNHRRRPRSDEPRPEQLWHTCDLRSCRRVGAAAEVVPDAIRCLNIRRPGTLADCRGRREIGCIRISRHHGLKSRLRTALRAHLAAPAKFGNASARCRGTVLPQPSGLETAPLLGSSWGTPR